MVIKEIKEGFRYYINITNRCNTNCPFCCMYSSTENNLEMDFATYCQVLKRYEHIPFEVQLEGGEPLLHKKLYLFIEYAASLSNCKKIIIVTNGLELDKHLKKLISISKWHNIAIEIKVSVNYWLLEQDKKHLEKIANYIFAIEYIEKFSITLNVRKRKDIDASIDKEIERLKLKDYANSYYLQSYGKFKNTDYDKPVIVQNIEKWGLIAVDGKYFAHDLIARSEHERNLANEEIIG